MKLTYNHLTVRPPLLRTRGNDPGWDHCCTRKKQPRPPCAGFFLPVQPMEKLSLTYRKVDDLIPYARTHSDAQVAEIAASIKEYGWTNPILTDGENGIIAGHGRLLAARKLGMTEVPTIGWPLFG